MKNLIMLFLVIAGAAVFVVFWDSPPEIFLRKTDTAPTQELPKANSYMKGTHTRKFDQTGQLAYVLDAEQGRYYKQGDRFELDNSTVVSSPQSEQPWRIESNRVRSLKAGKEIQMSGNVYAWQPLVNGQNEFRTSQLTYFPDSNLARTDRRVDFTSPTGTTSGIGMKADFNEQRYQMLGDVRAQQYGQ